MGRWPSSGARPMPNNSYMPQDLKDHQKKQPTDCEWMFGDAAMGLLGFQAQADLNPLRWSGSITFEKAIADIRKVQSHKDRPIILKIPSGVMSEELKFSNCHSAIDFLIARAPAGSVSPRHPIPPLTASLASPRQNSSSPWGGF